MIERWQVWLALEHEAVWTYSTIAARLVTLRDLGSEAEAAHRASRDHLMRRIRAAGGEPAGTLAAYGPDTSTVARSRLAARDLEQRIAAVCLSIVGESSGKDRRFSTQGLSQAALAELNWQGLPSPFPGAQPSPR